MKLRELLVRYKDGTISEEETLQELRILLKGNFLAHVDESARLDVFRQDRTGIPEVIFAKSKVADQTLRITREMLAANHYAFLTRVPDGVRQRVVAEFAPVEGVEVDTNEAAGTVLVRDAEFTPPVVRGKVGVISAGTSDIPVAEEAKVTATLLGCEVQSSYDVGIAGLHRIFQPLKDMLEAGVATIIVVAGMEGTLPGVVASLADVPVIGVPTSSGYGLGAEGVGALTTMLQSCSPGLLVVNIDNGFGAGAAAAMIARQSRAR